MEKKLTDEEIVKALENQANGYGAGIVGDLSALTLDLIHRQKAEIERLTEELKSKTKEFELTEKALIKNVSENVELQKQVDELKEERYYTEQDTAKEILIPLVKTEKQIDPLKTGIRWSILKGLCNHYGVEVE